MDYERSIRKLNGVAEKLSDMRIGKNYWDRMALSIAVKTIEDHVAVLQLQSDGRTHHRIDDFLNLSEEEQRNILKVL